VACPPSQVTEKADLSRKTMVPEAARSGAICVTRRPAVASSALKSPSQSTAERTAQRSTANAWVTPQRSRKES
jgi:hypothetical protein